MDGGGRALIRARTGLPPTPRGGLLHPCHRHLPCSRALTRPRRRRPARLTAVVTAPTPVGGWGRGRAPAARAKPRRRVADVAVRRHRPGNGRRSPPPVGVARDAHGPPATPQGTACVAMPRQREKTKKRKGQIGGRRGSEGGGGAGDRRPPRQGRDAWPGRGNLPGAPPPPPRPAQAILE